jgi:hypothetical protein
MCFDNVSRQVCDTLEGLPDSLDETYERIMMGKGKPDASPSYATVPRACHPTLSVAELALLLAFEFDAAKGGTPKLNADWMIMSKPYFQHAEV